MVYSNPGSPRVLQLVHTTGTPQATPQALPGYTLLPQQGEEDKSDAAVMTKEKVLTWLSSIPGNDVCWIVQELLLMRPGVLEPQHLVTQMRQTEINNEAWQERDKLSLFRGMAPGSAVIQFAAPRFYASNEESFVVLDVIRIGDETGESRVSYYCHDGSAVDGEAYTATTGEIVFQPGESNQQIQVVVIDNGRWNTTTEFRAVLKDPTHAVLGQYLFETRVMIIDTSGAFPTLKMKDADHSQVSPAIVLMEFFKMTWDNPIVKKGTLWCMFVDLTRNMWYFLSMFMTVYLLDYIIKEDKELLFEIGSSRQSSLVAYAGLTIGSVALLHTLDYSKNNVHMGRACRFVQNAVIRKFLNYTSQVREESVSSGDVALAITRDAVAVFDAYMSFLMLMSQFARLMLMVLFKLLSPYLFGTKMDTMAILPLLLFPLVLCPFLRLREKRIANSLTQTHENEKTLLDLITQTTEKFPMIVDYSRRGYAADVFSERLQKHSDSAGVVTQILLNTEYFAEWVTRIIVAAYVIYGGMQVLGGSLSIGMFVMDLKIFDAFGESFQVIFCELVDIQRTFPCMVQLLRLLNLPTDVPERMTHTRAQHALATKQRKELLAQHPGMVVVDIMPIVLNLNDHFSFGPGHVSVLNLQGRHEIGQNQLVAIIGNKEVGKKSLLHLISGRLLDLCVPIRKTEDSGVFVPAHLRVVSVSESSVFYSGTLYENLIFGMSKDSPGAARKRVLQICKMLSLSEQVMKYLDKEVAWDSVLSESNCKLLNLARALINNAEVICLHKPTAELNPSQQTRFLQVLQDHIACKGLGLDADAHSRRPRTVIFSTINVRAAIAADTIFSVSETGVSRLTKEDIKTLALHKLQHAQTMHA